MSPERGGINLGKQRFPRVSGDEPVPDALADFLQGFSPRERG